MPKSQPGNKHALKLTTDELKRDAYKQYCEWIASGNSKEAWTFKHPELSLTFKTMEKYIRESPSEFPPIQKEQAESDSLDHWLKLGKSMMVGEVKGCQPAIFQMFMRNKFGWDKESQVKTNVEPEARTLIKKMEDGS